MQVFQKVKDLQHFLDHERKKGKSIGLVPTMGALHKGHLKLIEDTLSKTELSVCSIFVNPTQFNNQEDLANYPRTVENDLQMLEKAGCHVVFVPAVDEIYPLETTLKLHFGFLEEIMEGAHRPGHFNGVGLIVSKLFHIVQADRAFFGQKDLQQVAVIKALVRDLAFPIKIEVVDTVRESSGLAMSSRNMRLSKEELKLAENLFKSLKLGEEMLRNRLNPHEVSNEIFDFLKKIEGIEPEYVQIVEPETLKEINQTAEIDSVAICLAAQIGPVRLIDNIVFKL